MVGGALPAGHAAQGGGQGITVEVIHDGQVALTATTTISVGSWQDASSEYVVP